VDLYKDLWRKLYTQGFR